jgi:nanoRNase/pAp phosphatase (c-di-AMP/oligoRNAs hydrolase)
MTPQAPTHRSGGLEEAADVLSTASSLVLATHERSDGDALAAVALAVALRRLGKTTAVLHDFPPSWDWLLEPSGPWPAVAAIPPEAVVVTLDTAHYARVAWPPDLGAQVQALVDRYGREAAVPLPAYDAIRPVDLVIDHHITNRAYGLLNWIEPARSAVAEMATDLLLELERRTGRRLVDGEAARLLFVGLVSSTNWFREDTGDHTWETARLLDARGRFDKAQLAARLDRVTLNAYRFSGLVRQAMRLEDGVAYAYIARGDLDAHGVSDVEAAALIDDVVRLDAEIALLFVEMRTGGVRVRLRSARHPMHELAARFGGGGHERAAGTVLAARADADRLVEEAQRMVRAGRRA